MGHKHNKVRITLTASDDTRKGVESAIRNFSGLGTRVTTLVMKFALLQHVAQIAINGIGSTIKEIYGPVEEFQLTTTKIAAIISSFQNAKGPEEVADNFKEAKDYAGDLILTLERIAPTVLASASDMQKMNEELIKQGIILDINNEKEVQSFANIANAVAVIAAGSANREIQIRQETRALLQGLLNMNSQLAMQIDAMVNGTLKEKLELWKKEGTVIENIGGLLKGYAAASEEIKGTWAAIGTTMSTIKTKILRNGFIPAYGEINDLLMAANEWLSEHADTLSGVVYRTWLVIKGIIESAFNLLRGFKGPLYLMAVYAGKFAYWFGSVLYVILPPLTKRIGKLIESMVAAARAAYSIYEALFYAASFDFDKARESFAKAKKLFYEGGKNVGEAFAGGFGDEVVRRFEEYKKNFGLDKDANSKVPKLPGKGLSEKELKAAAKLAKDWVKVKRELTTDINKAGLDQFYQKLVEISAKADELREKFKSQGEEAVALIDKWYSEEVTAVMSEYNVKLSKEERELRIASIEAVIEQEKRLLDLKIEASRISPEDAVREEIRLNDTLITQKISLLEASLDDYKTEEGRLRILKEIAKLRGQLLTDEEKALKLREYDGTFVDGMREGLNDWRSDLWTVFQYGEELVVTAAKNMEQGFSNFFFDAMTGKLESFRDYWNSFWQSLAKVASDMLAKSLMGALLGSKSGGGILNAGLGFFGSMFGGGAGAATPAGTAGGMPTVFAHAGGFIPKFHSGGLASDERFAILQTGEFVVNKKSTSRNLDTLRAINGGNAAGGDGAPIIINQIRINANDSKSFEDMVQRNPSAITGVVEKSLRLNGSMRAAVTAAI